MRFERPLKHENILSHFRVHAFNIKDRISIFHAPNTQEHETTKRRKKCSPTGGMVLIRLSCLEKGGYLTRIRTIDPQNSSPQSYQLRYNDYIPPFFKIAFIVSINIFQIESI